MRHEANFPALRPPKQVLKLGILRLVFYFLKTATYVDKSSGFPALAHEFEVGDLRTFGQFLEFSHDRVGQATMGLVGINEIDRLMFDDNGDDHDVGGGWIGPQSCP